jgi:predicted RNA-binding protein YlxR (DUF448 family)
VVARPDGSLAFGRTLPGRGAWLCRGSIACFDAAARRKAFERALRTTVGSEALASLRATLVNRARMSTQPNGIGPSSIGPNGIGPNGTESTTPPSTDDAHVEQTKIEEHRKD